MAIFQKSVIKTHLTKLDKEQVEKAYLKFKENYSLAKIEKIKQLKEEEYQDGFLRDLFVDVFGYTLKPDDNYNLVREFKNQADGKKADGAIIDNNGVYPVALAVIELKSTKTKDLKSITEQAFNYKNNQPDCKYVITSNFQKLRFYIDYANEYEEFDLFQIANGLTDGLTHKFELLYLILNTKSIFSDLPLKLKAETKFHEQEISGKLYKDYSDFKRKLFDNLTKNHTESNKLTLFKKSQKLLDRFLFILFAEDSGLLPPNSISRIIDTYHKLEELDAYKPIYDIYKQYFGYMNIGRKGKTSADNIPAYNGGLFLTDELLDNLKIDDEILIDDLLRLSEYDFNTEVDVNILGHIFEHSLSEIEEITAELSPTADTRGHVPLTSKRKKDGVFYTPKYITQYIVENTIGTLCNEKRAALEIEEIEFDGTYRTKDGKLLAKGKKLYQKLNDYKDWLLSLKIVDPACGSGAFLNQALNFLIQEHKNIDDIIAELTNTALRLFDTEKTILENNLYGVDINEESVEIAKLSLWLRTAQKGRKLSVLSNNIKCGNSLIDDPEIAGDKAFDWNKEFPQVFSKKEKKAWHITTATHNSRYSQRMFDNHVKLGEAIWISEKDEITVTETIAKIVKEDNQNVIAYNICGDHMHMLLVCEKEKLPEIVGKLKSVSGRKYNIEKGITVPAMPGENEEDEGAEESEETAVEGTATRGHVPLSTVPLSTSSGDVPLSEKNVLSPVIVSSSNTGENSGKIKYNSLWTQKFGKRKITDDNDLLNVINYIRTNRQKHELPENKKLEKIINEMTCSVEHAFRTEYNGGFDVVIGNPPYVIAKSTDEFYEKNYLTFASKDLYAYFYEKGINILKEEGFLGFISPSSLLTNIGFISLRDFLVPLQIKYIIDLGENVFSDASVDSAILILKNTHADNQMISCSDSKFKFREINKSLFLKLDNKNFNIYLNTEYLKLTNKIEQKNKIFNDYIKFSRGIEFGFKSNKVTSNKPNVEFGPIVRGGNIKRYHIDFEDKYILHDENNISIYKSIEIYKEPKILVRRIGNSIISSYDDSGYFNVCDVYNLQINDKNHYNLKVISAILNSSLINFYYDTKFKSVKKLFPKIPIQNLKLLPIPKFNLVYQADLLFKADKMFSLNQQLQEKKNKFLNRVKDNLTKTVETRGHDPLANVALANPPFAITINISKKLATFYNYDFKTFIAELKKQKVKLSLIQQDEWEDYFTTYKNEINQLQNNIKTTDKEIDQMVYELYGLTEEEIKIVEESVN